MLASRTPTQSLRVGDIVNVHGARCLIDRPLTLSRSHADGKTYWTDALVLNPGEHTIPESFLRDGRWTIQGNDLALWSVERAN